MRTPGQVTFAGHLLLAALTCLAVDITNLLNSPQGIELQWPTVAWGRYDVETATTPAGSWSRQCRVVADSNTVGWTDNQPDSPTRMYRLRVDKVSITNVRHCVYNIADVNTSTQREALVGSHFDMYVLEPVVTEKGEEDFDIAGLLRDIRQCIITQYHKDPIILAYVDIGQAEDWRWYWQTGWTVGNPEWIVSGDPDGWGGCYPVAFWYTDWYNIVIYGTQGMSHVQATLNAGFDGIYMDWVEAWNDTAVLAKAEADGVTNTAQAMFDFIEKIRRYAREEATNADPDYLVVAQNAADLYQEDTNRYEELIDAIACEAIWYDGDGGFDDWDDPRGYNVPTDELYPGWTEEVLGYLEPMKGRLPIFCCEYAQDINGTNYASLVYTNLALTNGFIPYCTRRSLQKLSTTPYPEGYLPHDYSY